MLQKGPMPGYSPFFECVCGSTEHTLKITYDKEDHEIYASIFLNDWQRWHKRLWIAVKYLFGYKCKYGHWDTWIMNENDIGRLKKLLQRFETDNQPLEPIDTAEQITLTNQQGALPDDWAA